MIFLTVDDSFYPVDIGYDSGSIKDKCEELLALIVECIQLSQKPTYEVATRIECTAYIFFAHQGERVIVRIFRKPYMCEWFIRAGSLVSVQAHESLKLSMFGVHFPRVTNFLSRFQTHHFTIMYQSSYVKP